MYPSAARLRLALALLVLVWTYAVCVPPARAQAAAPASPAEPSAEQVKAVIHTLEDPTERQRLIEQLQILAKATEKTEAPANEVQTATTELLQRLSAKLGGFATSALDVLGVVKELPTAVSWMMDVATDADQRDFWISVVYRLGAVLGLGYLAALLVSTLLRRVQRLIARQWVHTVALKALMVLALLLLEAVPVLVFTGVAYGTLLVVDPFEEIRLVALAWINASIITRVVYGLGRTILAPDAPNVRLVPAGDETAQYLRIWLRRVTGTAVFGFFGLQAAVLLGLKGSIYEALLALLGLVVTAMLLVFIMQNRQPVAGFIRGEQGEGEGLARGILVFRRRLGQTWHLLAAVYVVALYGVWVLEVRNGFTYLLKSTALTLLALLVARVVLHVLRGLFDRGLRIRSVLQARFPGLDARVNRYFPVLHGAANALVYAVTAGVILQAWGADIVGWISSEPGRVLGGAFARILGIVAGSVLIWEVASSLIERHLDELDEAGGPRARTGRAKTLFTVARNALMVVLAAVSTLMVLSELGVNIGPLLAGAGVFGLAVGFGAQRLVQDVITGVFILFQDLMAVGDVVKLGDRAGVVEALSIRSVRLRDLAGTVHTIPFSTIDMVSNLTREFSYYVFDLGVAYREDVDEVMDLIREVSDELQADPETGPEMLEPIEIFGVDAFADSAVIIKGRIKTRPIKQWLLGRAFNRRIKLKFDQHGVEIPFPHRTLYFGEDKDGAAPAARVQVAPGITMERPPYEALGEPAAAVNRDP